MNVQCLSVNYYNTSGQPMYTPTTPLPNGSLPPTQISFKFNAQVTFVNSDNNSDTFSVTFSNIDEVLPYLPSKKYVMSFDEVVETE